MHLYHLTVLPSGAATHVAYGAFSAPRQQEVVVANGSSLQLFRLTKAGQVVSIGRADTFACIRAIAPFRLTGSRQDYLLVTSDAGTIALLCFSLPTRSFTQLRCETFGKTGCRRIVPGQFLAADPKGRACMVAAVERSKFVYILTRQGADMVALQSPLEAHKSSIATIALVALDVGFDNPVFVAIERPYEPADASKLLVYYELELGLNHVVRKHSSKIPDDSYVLLSVPGGTDGPGGVLVCSTGRITYRSLMDGNNQNAAGNAKDLPILDASLPHRKGMSPESSFIVCGTTYQHKTTFFFILCSELGDLFKVEMEWSTEKGATALHVFYFDTMPAPAHALAVFRSGCLFAALETGEPLFLKFRTTEPTENDPAGGFTSARPIAAKAADQDPEAAPNGDTSEAQPMEGVSKPESADSVAWKSRGESRPAYKIRDELAYFTLLNVIESIAPVTCLAAGDFCEEGSTQLVCTTGRGKQASLRLLRRGLAVFDQMSQSMPGRVELIATLKETATDEYDRYILVGFATVTKILKVSDGSVAEVSDTGLLSDALTLGAVRMRQRSLAQVHENGVRFVPHGKAEDAWDWRCESDTIVTACAMNEAQVLVSLASGQAVLFEASPEGDALAEATRLPEATVRIAKEDARGSAGSPPSIAIADVPRGQIRARFAAVSDGLSNIVRIYQITTDNELRSVGVHMAPARVSSLAFVEFGQSPTAQSNGDSSPGATPTVTLVVGTGRGALVTLTVDSNTGALSDKRTHLVGSQAVSLQKMDMGEVRCCMALSSRPYFLHRQCGRVAVSPLCTDPMDHVAAFSSEQYPDSFVATTGSTIRFLSLESLTSVASASALPPAYPVVNMCSDAMLGSAFFLSKSSLGCTPRRVIPVRARRSGDTRKDNTPSALRDAYVPGLVAVVEAEQCATFTEGDEKERQLRTAGPDNAGQWASQIRLMDIRLSDDGADEADGQDSSGEDDPLANMYAPAGKTLHTVPLVGSDRAALCAISAPDMLGRESSAVSLIVVSVAVKHSVRATSADRASTNGKETNRGTGELQVYEVSGEDPKLHFLHATPVEQPVTAMSAFREKLIVGIGRGLRIYGLGKKQLLRKLECRLAVANQVCAIATAGGDRVFVGDALDSVTLLSFVMSSDARFTPHAEDSTAGPDATKNGHVPRDTSRDSGQLVAIAREVYPRCVVSLMAIDYSTVCGSDKFGNLFILRLPPELAGTAAEGALKTVGRADPGLAHTRLHALSVEANIHVGSIVTGLAKASIRAGHGGTASEGSDGTNESVIYATIGGTIGVLHPFTTKSDATLASGLERELRDQNPSLLGRSHVSYRSSYSPVRNVVDGDLCELIVSYKREEQKAIASRLERDLDDILRKVEEFRSAIL